MDSYSYWSKREQAHSEAQKLTEEQVAKKLRENLEASKVEIGERIQSFYDRYATSEGISLGEAMKRVSEADIKSFERRYKSLKNLSPEAEQELKLVNATMKINRLELIKAEIDLELIKATDANSQIIEKHLRDTAYAEYERQAGIMGEFRPVSQRHVLNLINSSITTAGEVKKPVWNETLWTNQQELSNELSIVIRRAITQGVNSTVTLSRFAEKFDRSKSDAKRLLVTETAYVQGLVQVDCFTSAGFDRYVYLAEKTACEICGKLDGKDFALKDLEVGKNFYPMHPYCKCSSAPLMSDEEFEELMKKRNGVSERFKEVLKGVDFSKSRRTIAKQVLDNLGIGDIPISIKKIPYNGQCRYGIGAGSGNTTMLEYVLNSQDQRSSDYQIKTIFHEAYHAMNQGRKNDRKRGLFGTIGWQDIEETFAETSAHYAMKQAGITTQIAPAYSERLVNVLPRLKKLDKFKDASTLSDFGEIAWSERLSGQASTWEKLAKEASDIDHDWVSYGKQYSKYIRENESKLLDKMFENIPQYDDTDKRKVVVGELHNALDKAESGLILTGNERMVYSNMLSIAMDSIGVK